MITCLRDEMKWHEWCRHCDIAFGYYRPSEDMSKRGSSASGDPESLSLDDVEGWVSGAENVDGWRSQTERDSMRFHHATQNGAQFTTYELFISGIFHLTFSDQSWPQVTETVDNWRLLYLAFSLPASGTSRHLGKVEDAMIWVLGVTWVLLLTNPEQ